MWSIVVIALVTVCSVHGANIRRKHSDVCDNFYEHACQEWKLQNPIPEGLSSWSKREKGAKQLVEEASEVLLTSAYLSHLERQAQMVFVTCLRATQHNDCSMSALDCMYQNWNVVFDGPFNATQLRNSSVAARETCLHRVSMRMPGAIESIYLRLPSKRATVVDDAVERAFRDVIEVAIDEIGSTRWLDAASKVRLAKKLGAMRLYGTSAFIERVAIANKCFARLSLKQNNSLELHTQLLGLHGDYAQCWPTRNQGASNPLIRWPEVFFSSLLDANAYYSREENYVVVHPAFLHHEALANAWSHGLGRFDDALYGTLVFVLGHEVAHAIDNTGIRYDKDGNESGWLPAASLKVFRKKQQCLELWYSSRPIPGTNSRLFVNGTLTLGENMADLDGLKFASKALDIRRKRVGLPAASKQKFFKSFAELACENVTPSRTEFLAAWDTHSPWPVRVNEALRNNAEFAEAYVCKQGSPMNPAEKCHVWGYETIR